MRYGTPIYFQKLTPGEYDPATGNYGEDAISEDMKSASVMDTGTNTMMLVYSEIKEGSLTKLRQLQMTGQHLLLIIKERIKHIQRSKQ